MIYWRLFLTFLEIGAVSFGGGYGMISLIRERMLANAWLAEEELLNMIAVAESTPGPIAVNMATFVGSSQGGLLGAFAATLGVVLPSFLIILLIAAAVRNFLKYRAVNAFLGGVRPAVTGMILTTAVTMLLSGLFGISDVHSSPSPDWIGVLIFALLLGGSAVWKRIKQKAPSPIVMILISAVLGMLLYGTSGG